MPDNEAYKLLYDPMPRPDVKIPPLSEPQTMDEQSKKLERPNQEEDVAELLSNLSFV